MGFPLTQTIGHKVYTPGAVDSHNNPVDDWEDPVDLAVIGLAPATSGEPGGTQVVTGVTVYSAPGFNLDPRDRFVYKGVEWMVDGEEGDWTDGPFGFEPGGTFNLKRVEGGR
jgi:hypothetical protein